MGASEEISRVEICMNILASLNYRSPRDRPETRQEFLSAIDL